MKNINPILDEKFTNKITAFLFHRGDSGDPTVLSEQKNRSFIGYDIKGDGFLFDDNDSAATSLSTMKTLELEQRNQSLIYPYLGGEEINTSPTHKNHRFAINFGERTLEECKEWPALLSILEKKVKPERERKAKEVANWPWWQYWRVRGELQASIRNKSFVYAVSRVSQYFNPVQLRSSFIFSDGVVVFADSRRSFFSCLQARPHELWGRFFASSMKDDLRYTPSDCFETFPFPRGWEQKPALEAIGQRYHDFRAALMIANNEGLTKTYNRFHDPDHDGAGVEGRDPRDVVNDIETLRTLHDEMDRAVLDAYGWTDLRPTCEFLLDYEEEADGDDDDGKRRKKKKPWRYRWPDDVRDEVLARLLELNKQYAQAEKGQHEESQLDKDTTFALTASLPSKPAAAKKKATTKKASD